MKGVNFEVHLFTNKNYFLVEFFFQIVYYAVHDSFCILPFWILITYEYSSTF